MYRINPDIDLRELERTYNESGSDEDFILYRRALRRAGLQEQANNAERNHLWPYLKAFYTAFKDYDFPFGSTMPAYNLFDDVHGSLEQVLKAALALSKETLIKKSRAIGISPSKYCYRPYFHIPYTNSHLKELAYLYNTVHVDVYRDDDAFVGLARFLSSSDAQEFLQAITEQFNPLTGVSDRLTIHWRIEK